MGSPLGHRKTTDKQVFEIVLDLKLFSFRRARKSRGVDNDSVKFLASSGKARQHRSHVIGDETMILRRQIVQGEILTSTGKRLFGKIDVESACLSTCCIHGKGTGISETI